jgi:hypothetical protein
MPPLTFIDVGEPTAQRKRQNANEARSLVMLERRRRTRAANQNPKTQPANDQEDTFSPAQDHVVAIMAHPSKVELTTSKRSRHALIQTIDIRSLDGSVFFETDIAALHGYNKPVTKHMHKLVHHGMLHYAVNGTLTN